MKKLFLIPCIIFGSFMQAQVGIGTVTPEAQLDIRSSNQATPANNDGILIPRIDEFPATFPTGAQDGMMVFATGNGSVGKGFYYWDDVLVNWVAVGSGDGEDWYEEGTTTAPDNINDDIYTFGNVAIGKNTADYKLDVFEETTDRAAYINLAGASNNPTYALTTEITNTGNGEQRGLNTILNSSGSGTHTGSYVTMNGDGSGETRAYVASINGNATGSQRGFYVNINNAGDGLHYGSINYLRGNGNGIHSSILNQLIGAGTGNHYGTRNELLGTGSGAQLGVRNVITNTGDGDHYGLYSTLSGTGQGIQLGTYNSIDNTGDNTHYGILNQLSGTGAGTHYAIRNELSGTGTGDQEGISTHISNTNDANHIGFNTRLSGTGSGNHIGAKFSMSNTGNGFHTGIYTTFSEGIGILTGNWTEFGGNVGSSSQNQIAAYNSYFAGGNGILAGSYTDIRNSVLGTGSQYGSYTTNSSPGGGIHYGSENVLSGNGTGEQYGVHNTISNTGNATHVGVQNVLSGTGSGYQSGVISKFSAGNGNLTGYWTEFNGSLGNGNQIAAYNSYFTGGNGILAGAYTDIRNTVTGTGSQYGTFTANDSPGNGAHYGNFNQMTGTGTGAKYGTYNSIPAATGGTHYGVYSDAQKVGSYAGYFLGNFAVDANTLYVDAVNNRVGIGTNAPATSVHITQGTTNVNTSGLRLQHNSNGNYWTFYTAPTNNLWFAYNGTLASWIQPNGTYNTSDKRLKTNIKGMSSVLERVMKLNPVSYQYISDENHKETIGFLAQEVEPLFPESVAFESDYEYYGLKYDDFGVIAIKAIQEQQTEIELLKKQLEEQKAELLELKNLIMGKQ